MGGSSGGKAKGNLNQYGLETEQAIRSGAIRNEEFITRGLNDFNNAMTSGTSEALKVYQHATEVLFPFSEAARQAVTQANKLLGLPGPNGEAAMSGAEVTQYMQSLPGYQFQFNQGQQALERSAAAKGMLNSGNLGTALAQYGQDYAQNYYGQHLGYLNQVASNPNTQAYTQSLQALGQLQYDSAAAKAQAALTANQAIGAGYQNAANSIADFKKTYSSAGTNAGNGVFQWGYLGGGGV